nr:hypothetical protein [Streptomyces lincolnensis]
MISMHAKASMGFQYVRIACGRPGWRSAKGSKSAAPRTQRVNTTKDGDSGASTATLIIR